MCSINGADNIICSKNFKDADDFSAEDRTLIHIRSGAEPLENVCSNHARIYLNFYQSSHPKCEDPDGNHKATKRKVTNRITLPMYYKTQYVCPELKPGQGLCVICFSLMMAQSKRAAVEHIMGDSSAEFKFIPPVEDPPDPPEENSETLPSSQSTQPRLI